MFRLVKAGYAQGIEEARRMTVREVLQALAYEGFLMDYQAAFKELNK